MCITQKIFLWTASLGLITSEALGQIQGFSFLASSSGNYRQTAAGVIFEGGNLSFNVQDGSSTTTCRNETFFNPTLGCPLGATGYVTPGQGGFYASVSAVLPAQLIKPFESQRALLVAAPPSLLPRPQIGFVDNSFNVFYNLQTNAIKQLTISSYSFNREYSAEERNRFDGEVVPGTYRFNFASRIHPTNPIVLDVNQFPMIDGFRKVNNQTRGYRFLNVNFDEDGFALLDPLLINTLVWQGNTADILSANTDQLFLSIKPLTDPNDPLSGPDLEGDTLFPGFTTSTDSRIILPSPLDTSFILPPNFLQPGQTGLLDIQFVINRVTSNVVSENSTRSFRLPVKMIESFGSLMIASALPGTPAEQLSMDADMDSDGKNNFTEWVFGSDPSSSERVPVMPAIRIVSSDGSALLDASAPAGSIVYSVPKLNNPSPKLNYTIEYSDDMQTWATIQSNDPKWVLEENTDELKVTSSTSNLKSGGFFRTKVEVSN